MKTSMVSVLAQMDQLDGLLADNAEALHHLSHKPIEKWNVSDIKLIKFALHAASGRAIYLAIRREEDDI